MTWAEIDRQQAIWRLGRQRTKSDRAHVVPLSNLALSILDEGAKFGGCDFVFTTGRRAPGAADGAARPLTGWAKAKARLDRLALTKARELAAERGEEPPAEFPAWVLHDARRTVATNLARLGVDRIVISKILNHSEGGVTSIYDRHARDDEKRRALELWAQRLQRIVGGDESGSNVVQLRAPA